MATSHRLEVREFMVGRLNGENHTALQARPGSGLVYDGVQDSFFPGYDNNTSRLNYDEIYLPCVNARDDLVVTANKYRKKLKQPPLDIETKHSWTEVEESVTTACKELDKLATEDKNVSSRIKRAFRGLCRHAGIGQTFTSMVPNDSFNSVLCGGLKAIFAGLRQAGAYRQQVYKALEDLPYVLNDHASRIRIYYFDEELHRLNALLFVAVFELLNHILLWFMRNSLLTGLKVVVDPSGFSEELNERLAQVKVVAARFERHAMTLSLQMQRAAIEQQTGAAVTQNRMDENLQKLLARAEDMEERLARTAVLQSLDPLLLDQMMEAFERKFLVAEPAMKRLRSRSKSKQRQEEPSVSAKRILEHFLYDPELVVKDYSALKRQIKDTGRVELDVDRLKALQTNYSLRAFLTINEPSLILLNGRADVRPDSEVSVFTAHVVDRLLQQYEEQKRQQNPPVVIIPAAFFCGRHRDYRNDVNAEPEEAAMSLLLQLIDRLGAAISPSVLQACYEKIDPRGMTSICEALDILITSLKSDVFVFIVMDGLRYFFLPPERAEKTRELVSRLVQIYRKSASATLKFLFANPTKAEFVEDLFEEYECVNIARNPKATDGSLSLSVAKMAIN